MVSRPTPADVWRDWPSERHLTPDLTRALPFCCHAARTEDVAGPTMAKALLLVELSGSGRYWARTSDPQLVDYARCSPPVVGSGPFGAVERNRASGLSARSPSMVISASHESRMAAPLIAASEPERVSRRSRLPERRTGRYRPGRSALARDLLIRAQAGVIAGPSGRDSGSSSCGQRQPVSTPMTAAREPVGMGESISEVCTTRTRDLGTSDLESALHVLGRAGYVRFCERPASCGVSLRPPPNGRYL